MSQHYADRPQLAHTIRMTRERIADRPKRVGWPDCPLGAWLHPWQLRFAPGGCPDHDWCRGNRVCYWRCNDSGE